MRPSLLALLLLAACQMTAPADVTAPPVSAPVSDAIEVTTLADAPATPPVATAPVAEVAAADAKAAVRTAGGDTPRPKPRPGRPASETAPAETAPAETAPAETAAPETAPAETAAPEAPAEPVSPQQALCLKSGGQWAAVGDTEARTCVKPTRDGGKRCSRKTDCQGQCLARSRTCAPIEPLLGCNEILEKDGRLMTLCLN